MGHNKYENIGVNGYMNDKSFVVVGTSGKLDIFIKKCFGWKLVGAEIQSNVNGSVVTQKMKNFYNTSYEFEREIGYGDNIFFKFNEIIINLLSYVRALIEALFNYHVALKIIGWILCVLLCPIVLPFYGITFLLCFIAIIERKILKVDKLFEENKSISPFGILYGFEVESAFSKPRRNARQLCSFGFESLGNLDLKAINQQVKYRENQEKLKQIENRVDSGEYISRKDFVKEFDRKVYTTQFTLREIDILARDEELLDNKKLMKLEKVFKFIKLFELPLLIFSIISLIISVLDLLMLNFNFNLFWQDGGGYILIGIIGTFLLIMILEEVLCLLAKKLLPKKKVAHKYCNSTSKEEKIKSSHVNKKTTTKENKYVKEKVYRPRIIAWIKRFFKTIGTILAMVITAPIKFFKFLFAKIRDLIGTRYFKKIALSVALIAIITTISIIIGVNVSKNNVSDMSDEWGKKEQEEFCLWSEIKYEGHTHGCSYEKAYRECVRHQEKEYVYIDDNEGWLDLDMMNHNFDVDNICVDCSFNLLSYCQSKNYIPSSYTDFNNYVNDYYDYLEIGGNIQIIGLKKLTEAYQIVPSYFDGKPVTMVSLYWYENKVYEDSYGKNLDSTHLLYYAPNGYENYCYLGCYNLETLSLYGNIKRLDTVAHILYEDYSFFQDETSYLSELYIYNQVEEVSKEAFKDSRLKRLEIIGGITTICEKAFYGNSELYPQITLTESCLSIGEEAFRNNELLKYIYVEETNPNFCSIDGVVYSKDRKELLIYSPNRAEQYLWLPDECEVVNESAFNLRNSTHNPYYYRVPNFCVRYNIPIFNFESRYLMGDGAYVYLSDEVSSVDLSKLTKDDPYDSKGLELAVSGIYMIGKKTKWVTQTSEGEMTLEICNNRSETEIVLDELNLMIHSGDGILVKID